VQCLYKSFGIKGLTENQHELGKTVLVKVYSSAVQETLTVTGVTLLKPSANIATTMCKVYAL
jgi:hypothetical protein